MFSSQSAPALLFFFGLFLVAESPRWLIRKRRDADARRVLERVGGVAYANTEGEAIRQSFSQEVEERVSDLFRRDVWYIVLIGILIAVFSQAGGQNSLFSFAPEIFKQAGMAEDSAFLQSVILGLINFVFTFVAIGTIDKAGRKKLLQYGAALLCLDAMALAAAFYFGSGPAFGFLRSYWASLPFTRLPSGRSPGSPFPKSFPTASGEMPWRWPRWPCGWLTSSRRLRFPS
jgi:hypothetical protein